MDFAFFAVNFGYSKRDYLDLTPSDKLFILKAWENRVISDSYNIYNASFTAFYNVNRPKRKRALKLWKKKSVKKADMDVIRDNVTVAREVIEKEGINWVDQIYKANGMKRPRR